MGYYTSNTAYAYDMQPQPAYPDHAAPAPLERERPHFDVVEGTGKASSLDVSPIFAHTVKVVIVLTAVFAVVFLGRIVLSTVTAQTLDANAVLSSTLSSAKAKSADLEVMHSVYDSDSRISELARSYGMTEAEGSTTVDISASSSSTGSTVTSTSAISTAQAQ